MSEVELTRHTRLLEEILDVTRMAVAVSVIGNIALMVMLFCLVLK